jgi:hypothetical protein
LRIDRIAVSVVLLAACEPAFDDSDALPSAQVELRMPTGRRCAQCGRIVSKRELTPRVYEYTLRMPDGSTSVFLETLPATWRVGERVGVIEGSDPAPN